MYESHFGFSGSPFQLNPDPAFYFDSRGHSNALAYLKFGAHQGEGFIVVTGEIGAGKTTLVRTLLEGLNPDQVVAAQVVSTQLESSELLQAILMAFGIPSANTSKAHLIANLEGFLTALAAKGRRALLIIDEAQNLKHEAVEELRMLSNFQLGKYGLLQSFLVGQPELRGLLQSKSMEQLRQRVIASCHLGPLDEAETRAYVEHRLKRVGWTGSSPAFAPGALECVYRWTGGVPRKINRLCNRMLLGAFLANANSISLALVDETATELRNEIGEAAVPAVPLQPPPETVQAVEVPAAVAKPAAPVAAASTSLPEPNLNAPVPPAAETTPPVTAPLGEVLSAVKPGAVEAAVRAAPRGAAADTAPSVAGEAEPMLARRVERRIHRQGELMHPLVCLVDSTAGYLKAGLLQGAFEGFPSLPGVVALHVGAAPLFWSADLEAQGLPLPARGIHLGVPAADFAARSASLFDAVDAVLDELNPCAVMVLGSSDDDLACAMLANKRGLRLLRVGSGQRDARDDPGHQLNAVLIERIADLHFTDSTESFYALYREGIRLDRVRSAGNLTNEMLDHALTRVRARESAVASSAGPTALQTAGSGYAMVGIDATAFAPDSEAFAEIARGLSDYGKELPLVWAVDSDAYAGIVGSKQAAALKSSGIAVIRDDGYLPRLELLRGARCLLTLKDGALLEEATAMRIPVVKLDWGGASADPEIAPLQAQRLTRTDKRPNLRELILECSPLEGAPEYWHVGTASRIAAQLVAWLAKAAARSPVGAAGEPIAEGTHEKTNTVAAAGL